MLKFTNSSMRQPSFFRSPSGAFRAGAGTVGILVATVVLLALGNTGCGTNLGELFLNSANALARAQLDLLLAELANDLADAAEEADADDADGDDGDDDADNGDDGDDADGAGDDADGGDAGDDGGGDAGSGDDPDAEPIDDGFVGNPAAGEALFAACVACHCPDASGGCFPGAPSLVGVSAELLDENLLGDDPHPIKPDLTDQELADLEAYLASLGG